MAVVIALVAFPFSATAGDFWILGNGKDGPSLADVESIKTVGELKSITTITILTAPESFYGGQMVRRKNTRWMVDCQTRSYQHVGFDLISGSGELLSPNDMKSEWIHAAPKSIGGQMVGMACDGPPKDRAEGHYSDISAAQAEYYAILQKH